MDQQFVPQEPLQPEPESTQATAPASSEPSGPLGATANGNGHYHAHNEPATAEANDYGFEPQQPVRRLYQPPQQTAGQMLQPPSATVTMKVPQARIGQLMNANDAGHVPGATADLLTRTNRNNSGRVASDAAYLDAMVSEPESLNWELRVDRFLPIVLSGRNLPCEDLMRLKVVPLDALRQQIIQAWGGGEYRVAIMYKNGDFVQGKRTVTISINQSQHPPKFEAYDGGDANTASIDAIQTPEVDEELLEHRKRIKQLEMESQIDLAEERSEKAKLNKRKAKINLLMEEKRVQQMERELNGNDEQKNAQVEMLKLQMDMTRKQNEEALRQAEERRKEDERRREQQRIDDQKRADEQRAADKAQAEATNRMFMEGMKTLAESIKAIAEKPAPQLPPPPPDKTPELITALATALRPQLPAPTEDKGMALAIELVKNNTAQQQAAAANENKLIYKMLDVASKPQPSTTVADTIALIERGEKNVQKTIELVQNSLGNDHEEEQAPANGGWAAVLQQIALEAAKTPAVAALLTKVIGTANPSDQQIAATAAMWERQGVPPQAQMAMGMGMPPPVQHQLPMHPNQGQQQGQPPSLEHARPVYDNPYASRPMQQLQGQAIGQPPPVRAQAQHGMTAQQRAQQAQVVAQQAHAAQQAQAQAAQQAHVQQVQQTGPIAPNPESEQRLREAVTESMLLCCEAIEDQTKASRWVEHADENWHAAFKRALLMAPSNDARTSMISQLCDHQVIARLVNLMTNDPTGAVSARFYGELGEFLKIQADAARAAQAPAVTTTPVAQAPAPVPVDPAVAEVAEVAAQV